MKVQTHWNEKMQFTASADGHEILMDTKPPIGADTALTPKQLLLAAISGCTAMDAVALLKKHKQPLEKLEIEADAKKTQGKYPEIFESVHLEFKFMGAIDPARALEAVQLSQTKYCGVSAMVVGVVPIFYEVFVNGSSVGKGQANFSEMSVNQ